MEMCDRYHTPIQWDWKERMQMRCPLCDAYREIKEIQGDKEGMERELSDAEDNRWDVEEAKEEMEQAIDDIKEIVAKF